MQAPPMPVHVSIALAWFFIRSQDFGGAFLILTGVDCFLRTGELLSLISDDVPIGVDGRGAIKLAHTKTGQRHAAFEAATVNDPACGQLFRRFRASLAPNTSGRNHIFMSKPHVFFTNSSSKASRGWAWRSMASSLTRYDGEEPRLISGQPETWRRL